MKCPVCETRAKLVGSYVECKKCSEIARKPVYWKVLA